MNDLIEKYSPLVKSIVNKTIISSAALDKEDLEQVGLLAALDAARYYDPTRGTNMNAFIYRAVWRRIHKEAASFFGGFTVDFRVTSLACKVNKLRKTGKSNPEIAKELGIKLDKVVDCRFLYDKKEFESLGHE